MRHKQIIVNAAVATFRGQKYGKRSRVSYIWRVALNRISTISMHIMKESTAGADASVEVQKLHNIKLLIASFYAHIDYNYHDEHFLQGKLKEWVMIDDEIVVKNDRCQTFESKINGCKSAEPCSSLLTLAATNS